MMANLTPLATPKHDEETVCRQCGTIDTHETGPGAGPHLARLTCSHCKSFIKWVGKPREHKSALPPTLPQLRYVTLLGYRGEAPRTRTQASQLINELKQTRGAA